MAENGTEWHDLGYFRVLVMVSTDNVFVFSDSGCSQRRDRGRFPGKATGFLADLRYSCRSPRLADWRQLGPGGTLVSLRRKKRDAAIRGLSPIFAPVWFLRLTVKVRGAKFG